MLQCGDIIYYHEVEWGDLDMEWMTIDSCAVLYYYSRDRWYGAFDGKLHGICGFHNIAHDSINRGRVYGQFLTGDLPGGPRAIGEAWKLATEYYEDNSVWGGI